MCSNIADKDIEAVTVMDKGGIRRKREPLRIDRTDNDALKRADEGEYRLLGHGYINWLETPGRMASVLVASPLYFTMVMP